MRIVTRLSKAVGPVVLAAFFALSLGSSQFASASEPGAPAVSGWTLVKFVQTQPACTGAGFQGAVHYQRLECGFGYAAVSGTTLTGALKSDRQGRLHRRRRQHAATQTATARTTAGSEGWQFTIQPQRLRIRGPQARSRSASPRSTPTASARCRTRRATSARPGSS